MKLKHYGIEHQKYYYHKNNIHQVLIFGLSVVYLQKWLKNMDYFVVIVKQIKSSRYFNIMVHQPYKIGQILLIFQILNQHSHVLDQLHLNNFSKILIKYILYTYILLGWFRFSYKNDSFRSSKKNICKGSYETSIL